MSQLMMDRRRFLSNAALVGGLAATQTFIGVRAGHASEPKDGHGVVFDPRGKLGQDVDSGTRHTASITGLLVVRRLRNKVVPKRWKQYQ